MIKVIHCQLYSADFTRLNQLIVAYSSCVRYCFARFQKDKLSFNDIRRIAKLQYTMLNSRQVADAANEAKGLYKRYEDNPVIFGSKKSWESYRAGKITKQQWLNRKNNQLYCRGEKTCSGNVVARVVNDNNKLRITVGHKEFVYYKLFVPDKYKEQLNSLLVSKIAYNVRIIRQDESHFKVMIDYQNNNVIPIINFNGGAIGVDVNPDRIALCNTNKQGNYVESLSLLNQKIHFASTHKREHEIALLVQQVIKYAKINNKGIVFESLEFKNQPSNNKRFNRMRSNFVFRKFLTLLENKCVEHGIEYKIVHPAYTSVIGKLKYKNIYNINIHESAAYVIARRGMGYNESLSLAHIPSKRVKEATFRHLEGKKREHVHSWVVWRTLRDKVAAVLTGPSGSMFNLKELNDGTVDLDQLEQLDSEHVRSCGILPITTDRRESRHSRECSVGK